MRKAPCMSALYNWRAMELSKTVTFLFASSPWVEYCHRDECQWLHMVPNGLSQWVTWNFHQRNWNTPNFRRIYFYQDGNLAREGYLHKQTGISKLTQRIDKDDIMNVINTVSLYLALSSLWTKLCTPLLLIQHFVSVIVLLVRLWKRGHFCRLRVQNLCSWLELEHNGSGLD